MTDIEVYEDGWLNLSTDLRQHLGIRTGDRLELKVTAEGLVLRPTGPRAKPSHGQPAVPVQREPGRPGKQASAEPLSIEPLEQSTLSLRDVPSTLTQEQPIKRGPGRPRKQASAEPAVHVQEQPAKPGPGRPRKQIQAEQLNLGEAAEPAPRATQEDGATPPRAAHLTFHSRGREIKIGGRRKLS